MVEYYYHRACMLAEDNLLNEMKAIRIPEDIKKKNLHGILKVIEPW